jgi:hypothetical protein
MPALSRTQVIRTESPYALPPAYNPILVASTVSGPYAEMAKRRFRTVEDVEVVRGTKEERWL